MQRDVVIGLVALAVAALGAWLYYRHQGTPAPAQAPQAVAGLQNPYTEHTPTYDISAAYPTETSLAGAAGDAGITAMQGWVIAEISRFKDDLATGTPQGASDGHQGTLEITYRSASAPHALSYVFTEGRYTGGAHGMSNFKTFVFDAQSGDQLALADLFASGAPYLTTLSALARARLSATLGDMTNEQMLEAGTGPEVANFADWYLDGGSLIILFPPYAVAPYAAGPQTVSVPLTELAALLRAPYTP